MKLIKEICHDPQIKCDTYKVRKAARTILVNDKDQIAILNVTNLGFHKICGGGIEFDEDIETALRREVSEETGAEIEIIDELGLTIEWKNTYKAQQISYCYISKVKGEPGNPQFTDSEKSDGFVLEWHTLEEAIKTASQDKPTDYHAKYMSERDLIFLIEYRNKTLYNEKR